MVPMPIGSLLLIIWGTTKITCFSISIRKLK